MQPVLSILIPTIEKRREMFDALIKELQRQISENLAYGKVEIIAHDAPPEQMTIGDKRNYLLDNSSGFYEEGLDDDDSPRKDLIKTQLNAIEEGFKKYPEGVDCLSLTGVITWNGTNPEIFEHSVKYNEYRTNATAPITNWNYVFDITGPVKYERFPNHVSVIKSSIAKQFRFPKTNHGEDTDWATQIRNSGLIKTEQEVQGVTYHYNYIPNK